jgi:hypothetical protein
MGDFGVFALATRFQSGVIRWSVVTVVTGLEYFVSQGPSTEYHRV